MNRIRTEKNIWLNRVNYELTLTVSLVDGLSLLAGTLKMDTAEPAGLFLAVGSSFLGANQEACITVLHH